MERELLALKRLLVEPDRPSTYILGGAKVEDKVPVIENILSSGKADHVLVGGNVAKVFLKAANRKFGQSDEAELENLTDEVLKANRIISKFRKRIVLPSDFGTIIDGKRANTPVTRLRRAGRALDIGTKTAEKFSEIISKSRTVVASGPMGVFEEDGFETGTKTVLESMGNSDAFTVIGGGHLSGYAGMLGISDKLTHVSTAGGAMLSLLAGEELPAIEALVDAAKRHKNK
jgi:phosphoglycerate kinase